MKFENRKLRKYLVHFARRVTAKGNQTRPINLVVKQRTDLAPFLQLAADVFEVLNRQNAVAVARDSGLAEQCSKLEQITFRAARRLINAAHRGSILPCLRWIDIFWGQSRIREIAIEKSALQFAARADRSRQSSAVIGNEKTHVRVGEEIHVAVKPERIAAMSDDSLPVVGIIEEDEAQSIQRRMHLELVRLHRAHRFRFQNRRVLKRAVLK